MKDQWIVTLIALLGGAALAFQVGTNSRLRQESADPIFAALVNFGVGAVVLGIGFLLAGKGLPSASRAAGWPWWSWIGGLLGAGYVFSSALLASRLGAAGWLATVVAGQIIASLLLDHHGWLGFPVRTITIGRVAGVVLLVAGVVLVLRR
jgi:transporter family-2 protein